MVTLKPVPRYQLFIAFAAFFLLALPGFLFWCYVFSTNFFTEIEPDFLSNRITPIVIQFRGLPAEIMNTLGIVVSAFLAATALRPQQRSYTATQISAIILLLVVTLTNLLVVVFFDINSPTYENVLLDGQVLLPKLINASNEMYKTSLSYILIIVGLQSQVGTRNED